MKKLIALLLCLLLPCAALAETADLDALWAQLTTYKTDLQSQSAALNAEVEELNWDLAYIDSVRASVQSQLDTVKGQQNDLNARLAAAEALLAEGPSAEKAEQVRALLPPPSLTGKHYVQIDIAGFDPILAELDADAAPITVTNFVTLVKAGFYDGLTFHRIINGFMMQGGCPLGNGTGGSGTNIKGEFSGNGVNNPITHVRGVLSMARSSAPNSASSQFFIMHKDAPHLNGQYAAFGRVLSGMETVDAICANTPVTDNNGTVAKANQPVITSIRVVEAPAQ